MLKLTGSSFDMSTRPGSGRPRSRANQARIRSQMIDRDVPAVHRQQRQQVEDADEDVERGDEQQHEADLVLPADVGGDRLARCSRAAPTTLLTWPAAVVARSLLNSLGSAAGSAATASTEPDDDLRERRPRCT